LYTQCPDCGTVFRVTADVLRVAQGAVCCGICSSTFNALESLRDEPRAILDQPPPEDTITVEEVPGNEMIELSSTEAEPAGAAAAAAGASEDAELAAAPAGGEEAAPDSAPGEVIEFLPLVEREGMEKVDVDLGPEELEFRGSADDLDRVFVLDASLPAMGKPAFPPPFEPGDEAGLMSALQRASEADLSGIEVLEEPLYRVPEPALEDLEQTDEFPILVLDERDADETSDVALPVMRAVEGREAERTAAEAAAPAAAVRPPGPAAGARPVAGVEPPRFLIPEELRRDLESRSSAGASVGLEPRDALGLPPAGEDDDEPRRWPLAAGAALLAVALTAQAVHFWRDDLARDPVTGPWVLRAYQSLGLPLDLPADLAALELRQWGATSDAAQPGWLKLRASIVNRAAFAQAYPLLRLSLQDRFGNTIGLRDVGPADYLPGGAAGNTPLLGAGQRADAEIVFVDPGRDAVGYELDLCLPVGDGVRCANPAPAATP
jgi:predicted Zn finger-like uncharacterized protein